MTLFRVNHQTSKVLFTLEWDSVLVLPLKNVLEGERSKRYLNRLRPQILSDMRLSDVVKTLSPHSRSKGNERVLPSRGLRELFKEKQGCRKSKVEGKRKSF